jgi:hypothetical protein
MKRTWLTKLFGPDTEVSTKRVVMVTLVVVQVVCLFLLMYFKIEIANKGLVEGILENLFWLTLVFGGFISAEPLLQKWNLGGPKNVVNQDVQEQTVINEGGENDTKTTRGRRK